MAFGTLNIDAEARDTWRDRLIPPTSFDDAVYMQEDNEQEISFDEIPNDENDDGISGRPNYVLPPNFFVSSPHHVTKENKYYIGRFGRKATTIDLLHQTAVAYIEDMGITSNFFMSDLHNPLAGQFSGDGVADPEVSSAMIANVTFCKFL